MTMIGHLKLPVKHYSVTAPGTHFLLGCDYGWLFETPIINNHSVSTPIVQVVLGDDDAQSFENPQNIFTVSLHQVPIFC